jgi:steroid 5-alpha reductase family enzyme
MHTRPMILNSLPICIMAHVAGGIASWFFDDMIWVDGVSGMSLAFASTRIVEEGHGGHPVVAALFAVWSIRLSLHLVTRRLLLGKRRARCVPPSTVVVISFTLSRLAWVSAMLLTMHSSPANGALLRYELIAIALAALSLQAFADAELLLHRYRNEHGHYEGGLWRFSRHPNMLGELMFQSCVCCIAMFHAPHKLYAMAGICFTATGILVLPGGVVTLEERARNAWSSNEAYERYRTTTPLILPRYSARHAPSVEAQVE